MKIKPDPIQWTLCLMATLLLGIPSLQENTALAQGLYSPFKRPAPAQPDPANLPPGTMVEAHEDTLEDLFTQALSMMDQNQLSHAEATTRRALAQLDKSGGKPRLKVGFLQLLAQIYLKGRQFPKAESAINQAMTLAQKLEGKESSLYGYTEGTLGRIFLVQGAFSKAEPALRDSLKSFIPNKGMESERAMLQQDLCISLVAQHKDDAVSPCIQDFLKERRISNPNPAVIQTTLGGLQAQVGEIYLWNGDLPQAEAFSKASIDLYNAHPPVKGKQLRPDGATLSAMNTLAGIYEKTNRPTEAAQLRETMRQWERKPKS